MWISQMGLQIKGLNGFRRKDHGCHGLLDFTDVAVVGVFTNNSYEESSQSLISTSYINGVVFPSPSRHCGKGLGMKRITDFTDVAVTKKHPNLTSTFEIPCSIFDIPYLLLFTSFASMILTSLTGISAGFLVATAEILSTTSIPLTTSPKMV